MSFAARFVIALAALATALVIVATASGGHMVARAAVVAACIALAAACLFRGRASAFAGSVLATILLCLGVAWFVTTLVTVPLATGRWLDRRLLEPLLPVTGLGYICVQYLRRVRFGFGEQPPPGFDDTHGNAVSVEFDDARVSVTWPTGETAAIGWHEVERVVIETNDSGPWGADVWWRLEGAGGEVAYPLGATGDAELLEEFPRRFDGFSDATVIDAMGSTSNARFVCWQRTPIP